MSHQVLSRKYRPQGFDELVGQEHVGRILRNAILTGRVGHAYLFVGPRGVGKTTTARIFARALNCAAGEGPSPDPCGTCSSCVDIAASADLDVVEMDAASNNHVEDVRRLREQVGYATVRSRYRIWIVDEVHMLSMPAFNAFLKTLEEPPEGVKFLFCTTEEHKLPDTFRSRCQRIEFRPIDASAMARRLEDLATREGVEVEDGLCDEIAAAALGGLRDAESLLEQLIAACPDGRVGRKDLDVLAGRAPAALLARLEEAVLAQDAAAALDAVDAALGAGCKPGVLLEQWMERLRAALVEAARSGTGVARVATALDVLLQKRAHLRAGADGTLVCQVAAVELARLPDARDLDRLVAALEGGDASAVASPATASPASGRSPPRPGSAPPTREKGTPETGTPETGTPETGIPGKGPRDAGSAWSDVVAAARAEDGRLAEALARARPGDVHEGRLDLFVRHDDALARSALERRDAVLRFRRVTQAVLGTPLAPRVCVDEAPEAPAAPAPAPASEHPVVRMVREQTGGRLLNLEEDEAGPPTAPGKPEPPGAPR